ncbi:TonB-dependent receptor [uncultured Bacteroides sp.]|uniref:SusC/RagA family TonB-linked outer membrane protein n=1 Tax=uncultured Bacteroides sp. TaxID=162156 RepID=UPI002AA67985|nr:TonB-dependent receptor [uncultured Bacteroides sp.]
MNQKTLARKAIVTLFLSLFCLASFAQGGRTVSGIIKDAMGEPMIGVNVLVKGTTNGVITDLEGKYAIKGATDKSTLVISFIGYVPQEIIVGNKQVINVILKEDIKSLDEVVVVGYGVQKKSDLTGSVGSVTAQRIASVGTSSVLGALQGASAGVDIKTNSTRPGGSFSIQVRGQNSMSSGSPLYVVDGIIVGDIDFLNPSDIERIDVLKDASSTAIYGSRGSNGVVLVQTKGAGSAKSKISVSYDGYYGVRNITRIPDFMDGREWTDYRTSRYYTWDAQNSAYALTTANQAAVTQNSKLVNTSLYNQDYTDWLDLGTQSGSQQNHYVNISGTNKDISYNIGAGYQNEKGNFLLENMEKYVVKGSVNHKASNFFSSGANFTLSHQLVNSGSQYGYRDLLRIPNVLKAYREDGTLIEQPGIKAEIEGDGNFTSAANPLIEIQSGSDETRRFDVLGSLFLEFTPLKELTIKTTFSPRYNRTREGFYREKNSNRTNNQAQNENKETFDWTWDNVVNFNKTFAKKHAVNVTLINSVYKSQYEYLKVYAENFPYDSQWYNIFKGTLALGNCGSSYSQTTMLSYAARANYDYAGKYLVTGTVRYDGSSKLAERWAAFPSAAVAWRMSEEGFMKDMSWIDNMKLRLSYGYSGNNNGVSPYGTQAAPNTSSNVYYDFNGNLVSGYGTGAPVNTALTWEKTREWNLGLDFGFFGGRINGAIDVYDKLSKGLLMSRTLTLESGVSKMTDNIGSVNNRGIEFSLNTVNVKTADWEWKTSFTFAQNKNAIRSLYGKTEDVISEARFIGKPINVIYDYKVNGVYSSAEWSAMTADQRTNMGATQPGYAKAIDTDGDQKMSEKDKVILGHTDPTWTGSLSSTLQYRNFDLSFNIYTRQGSFINDAFLAEFGTAANSQRGRPKVNQDYYVPANVTRFDWSQPFTIDANGQAWAVWGTSKENATAKYPVNSMTGNFYGNNGQYQDASFVKVRNITLGYTFPQALVKKAGISYARLYVNVLNPFTFTDYVGWDPEYATTSLESGNGPSSVTYQIGVNLKF